jgi:prophage antirepressor-like protein
MYQLPIKNQVIMETNIQIFKNSRFGEVRVTEVNGEPVFCLPDLCNILGLSNTSMVKSRLDDDLSLTYPILDSLGRTQDTTFVNETGLYDVILRSDSPKAKPFRKWVTSEVLPSIRKHGAYLTPEKIEEALLNPDTLIQLATNLKEERQKRLEAELQTKVAESKAILMQSVADELHRRNELMKPKALLFDKVMDCGQKIDIGQAAKILGLPFGRNTLFKKLREKHIFFSNRNEPKQEYIDRKYFELKEQWIDRENHDGFMIVKVLVTQKGLDFLAKTFELIPDRKELYFARFKIVRLKTGKK